MVELGNGNRHFHIPKLEQEQEPTIIVWYQRELAIRRIEGKR